MLACRRNSIGSVPRVLSGQRIFGTLLQLYCNVSATLQFYCNFNGFLFDVFLDRAMCCNSGGASGLNLELSTTWADVCACRAA